jgi:outer membrane receptor protein involved in Fe transport
VKLTDEAAPKDLLNRLNNILKFRGRGEIGWRQGPWTAELDINYTNRYTNDQVTPFQTVSADTTFDLRGSYTFGAEAPALLQDLEVTLGARNVLDEDPPFVDVQSGMDGSVASALGRVISLTVDKRW